jgi:hypothetical protein
MAAASVPPETGLNAPEALSRPEALARLRSKLQSLVDEEHCSCAVASRLGLGCGGFRQFSDAELRQRFSWIARTLPRNAPRSRLEELVNAYLLGRQEVTGMAVTCDVETKERDGCSGWNGFDNGAVEDLYWRVFGRRVRIG